jgi:hypothetical protein
MQDGFTFSQSCKISFMKYFFILLLLSLCNPVNAQKDHLVTEQWKPEPVVVVPGNNPGSSPSDAVILFNGTGVNAWQQADGKEAKWTVKENTLTILPGSGDLQTKEKWGDCQLHIEWKIPSDIAGEGQARGNSGIFFMGRYELQILDSYRNKTFSNGQAASVYKQHVPLVNASRPPGEWQSFDIIFTAPRFSEKGTLITPAYLTVHYNGVLVLNHVALWGGVRNTGLPVYEKHDAKDVLRIQDHGAPLSFRNIWIREL